MLKMSIAYQEWPYRQTFTFARETREAAPLFVVHVTDGTHIGRGECGLQSLKNETPQIVLSQLRDMRERIGALGTRAALNAAIPAQSSRNAVDCALWDLECKRTGQSIWALTGLARPDSIEVDITIGINSLEKMRADALAAVARGYRLLKLKADAQSVLEKVSAIAEAAPGVAFIVDANEAWSLEQLQDLAPTLKALNVVMIEQPLHHDKDTPLSSYDSPIPLCADESCATRDGLEVLADRYDAINIKLDKTGGLTEALAMKAEAQMLGFTIMIGCMVGTSLAMAPAVLLAQDAEFVDLDGPLLLARDREPGLRYTASLVAPPEADLWG